jgi:SAM-dependent methyltransferase
VKRPTVRTDATTPRCEICSGATGHRRLRGGGFVDQCLDCGHVHRSLTDCPARHRSRAYGGDPTLDVVRLWLTYRAVRGARRSRRVFEIGFGAGSLLRRFLDDGAEVAGIDARQFDAEVDPEVADRGRLWWGTMETLDADDLVVDLVYGVHVIEHVEDVDKTLRVAKGLLVPGGRLVLLTPAADSWGLRLFGSSWWLLEDPTHVRFFTARSARLACESAGFTAVTTRRLWADNLTMEVGSTARAVRVAEDSPGGVLSSSIVMSAGVLSAPLVLLIRLLSPRMRPTLCVEARVEA